MLILGSQSWVQHSRWGVTIAEQRGTIPSLCLLVTVLLMQPRARLAFWPANACLGHVELLVNQRKQSVTEEGLGKQFISIIQAV